MISRNHFRKSLTARKFIFMRRMLDSFALMMILQMKPDRSHPHEIIFKSRLSRVELEERTAGRPANRNSHSSWRPRTLCSRRLRRSDLFLCQVLPRRLRFDRKNVFCKNFSIIYRLPYRLLGERKFRALARRCQKLTTAEILVKYCRLHKNPPKKSTLNCC